jgi:hypothetical protein
VKKTTYLLALFLTIIGAFIAGCSSKELSRSKAQKLIEESNEYKKPFALELMQGETLLPYGKSMYVLSLGEETPTQAAERKVREYFEKNPQIAVANHLGLVEARVKTLDPMQPKQQYSGQKPMWSFEEEYLATDKAKALWNEYDLPPAKNSVPLAGKKIVEITGITKQVGEMVMAQFIWKFDPNEAGKAYDASTSEFKNLPTNLQQLLEGTLPPSDVVSKRENKTMSFAGSRQGQASFRRYDDGWRLESVIFQ